MNKNYLINDILVVKASFQNVSLKYWQETIDLGAFILIPSCIFLSFFCFLYSLWRIQDLAHNSRACLEFCEAIGGDRELHPVLKGILYDEVIYT